MSEADEISQEDLEAAADMHDKLAAGTFYDEHEKAIRLMRQRIDMEPSDLNALSTVTLEALIENWMIVLGGLTTKPAITVCRNRILEAQAILDEKRRAHA